MKSIKELRKNNKKGFTLVELIVVLVILAILAALLIPTLTGYIDKAKEKDVIAQTRQAVMATQTLVDEAYATKDVNGVVTVETATGTPADADVKLSEIQTLSEVKGAISNIVIGKTTGTATTNGSTVTSLTYTNKGKTCVYTKDLTNNTDSYKVQ